jgi:hypothetical protein
MRITGIRTNYGILAFCALALCATVASDAEAASAVSAVCKVTLFPQAGPQGDFGYVKIETFTGTCGNSPYWFCSTGATHKYCHPDYLYRERALISLYERLVETALNGNEVELHYESTGEAGNRKGMYVGFRDF